MSLNRVTLIGNLGRDPQIYYTDKDQPVCRLVLATSEPARTLPSGAQVPQQTDWHDILVWGENAKLVASRMRKGGKMYVEGKLKKRTYTDRDGKTREAVEIWGEKVELLSQPPTGQQ